MQGDGGAAVAQRRSVFMSTRSAPTIAPKSNLAAMRRQREAARVAARGQGGPDLRSPAREKRVSPPMQAREEVARVRRAVAQLSYDKLPAREHFKRGAVATELGGNPHPSDANTSPEVVTSPGARHPLPPRERVAVAVSRARSPIRPPPTADSVSPAASGGRHVLPWVPPEARPKPVVQEVLLSA